MWGGGGVVRIFYLNTIKVENSCVVLFTLSVGMEVLTWKRLNSAYNNKHFLIGKLRNPAFTREALAYSIALGGS